MLLRDSQESILGFRCRPFPHVRVRGAWLQQWQLSCSRFSISKFDWFQRERHGLRANVRGFWLASSVASEERSFGRGRRQRRTQRRRNKDQGFRRQGTATPPHLAHSGSVKLEFGDFLKIRSHISFVIYLKCNYKAKAVKIMNRR